MPNYGTYHFDTWEGAANWFAKQRKDYHASAPGEMSERRARSLLFRQLEIMQFRLNATAKKARADERGNYPGSGMESGTYAPLNKCVVPAGEVKPILSSHTTQSHVSSEKRDRL